MIPAVTPGASATEVCAALKRRRKPLIVLPGQATDEKARAEFERLQAAEIDLAQQLREKQAVILNQQARLEETERQLAAAKETIALLEKDLTAKKTGGRKQQPKEQPQQPVQEPPQQPQQSEQINTPEQPAPDAPKEEDEKGPSDEEELPH